MTKHKTWWLYSSVISAVLFAYLIYLWGQMNTYEVERTQLISEIDTNKYLERHWEKRPEMLDGTAGSIVKIKTGVFIQSLQFFNSSEVHVTGYVWQRYQDGINDQYKPGVGEVGFILPEQIDSSAGAQPEERYRYKNDGEEVIGWYFEATMRQPFNYSNYPFDHKTVWLRLWAKDFSDNVILVPDFKAYNATGHTDIFGIEHGIVLGTWTRENTFFNYKLSNYDTDFGIGDFVGQRDFPELHYNFVIKRKFENAFIVYLLPLLLVAALLFAALLTVTNNEELSGRLGFNTSGFIGASSALFFVVMLAHIQLREQFAGASIVYIEYFYILMYGLLVVATANTYLFTIGTSKWSSLIQYDDNVIPKIAYWPCVLLSLVLITLLVR